MTDREQECFYCIALSQIPHIGLIRGKQLYDMVGSATEIFHNRKELSERFPDLRKDIAEMLNCREAMTRAEYEMKFIAKNRIQYYTLNDEDYPSRFRDCDDAPLVLFFKGKADFNSQYIIAMVGTRKATDYGKRFCTEFAHDLKAICPNVVIISGLAYGIDILSHRAALENGLTTIGVLAHGLDRIYPQIHRDTAVKMLDNGGLITEFLSNTNPDPYNFVSRNRIVAGISDATIVIESAIKGGSLITAEIADGYNRDCFAVPGRLRDTYSAGCNYLIHNNKAALLSSAEDFVQAMGWISQKSKKKKVIQLDFFSNLSEEEQKIVSLLDKRGNLQINTLVVETGISINKMNSFLFELEMKGIIRTMTGGMYQLMQ